MAKYEMIGFRGNTRETVHFMGSPRLPESVLVAKARENKLGGVVTVWENNKPPVTFELD